LINNRKGVTFNHSQTRKLQKRQNAGDDDDFGGVKMEEVLAGRRRVKDVFDVLKCEEGGMGNARGKWEKQKKIN